MVSFSPWVIELGKNPVRVSNHKFASHCLQMEFKAKGLNETMWENISMDKSRGPNSEPFGTLHNWKDWEEEIGRQNGTGKPVGIDEIHFALDVKRRVDACGGPSTLSGIYWEVSKFHINIQIHVLSERVNSDCEPPNYWQISLFTLILLEK